MEDLGTYYAILFHDPQLRRGLVDAAERTIRSRRGPSTTARLGARVGSGLRKLADLIERSTILDTDRKCVTTAHSANIRSEG
jgi:hypothetical protein